MIENDREPEWLAAQLKSVGFERMVLGLLDEKLAEKNVSLDVSATDLDLIRWLNLLNGKDLDAFFEQECPAGLEFRRRQLSRGYDPLVAFPEMAAWRGYDIQPTRQAFINEVGRRRSAALAMMFADKSDREGCERLFHTLFGPGSPRHYRGLERRTFEWYWTRRAHLHFDRRLQRFTD